MQNIVVFGMLEGFTEIVNAAITMILPGEKKYNTQPDIKEKAYISLINQA